MSNSGQINGRIHVEFGKPEHGRLAFTFRGDRHVLDIAASAVPRNSIGDIAGAIALLLKGGSEATVTWNEEPTEHDFRFSADGDGARLTVTRYPNSSRTKGGGVEVLAIEGDRLEICLPFWRALRRLESSMLQTEYLAAWGRPFPEAKVKEITARVEEAKNRTDHRAVG